MRRRTLIKVAAALALAALAAALWFSPLRDRLTREHVRAFVEHLRGLWYGPLVFILAFAVGCLLGAPATIFIVAAGFIWGWALGGTYSFLGGLFGAVASFFLARFIGEGLLHRFGRVGRMVLKQADHAGFRNLLILRFIPGIPFAVLNYGAGVAGVRFRDYLGATALGITPPMFVSAYFADALFNGTMSEGGFVWRLILACLLMLLLVSIPVLVKRYTRRPDDTDGTEMSRLH